MARKPMVTRTITSQSVQVLCVDTTVNECTTQELYFVRAEKNNDKLIKKCKEILDTTTLKVVKILSTSETEEMYGMTESQFIMTAQKLDPETRKPIVNN